MAYKIRKFTQVLGSEAFTYHPAVIEQSQVRLEQHYAGLGYNLKLKRYSIDKVQDLRAYLDTLVDKKKDGVHVMKPGSVLTQEMSEFIFNEQLMCQIDFRYWAERYARIEQDAAIDRGIKQFKFWTPQEMAYRLIQEIEIEEYRKYSVGDPADGILVLWHKARQLGATAFLRLLEMHRMTTGHQYRAIAASAQDDHVDELYTRDIITYEHLPWYLCPIRTYDVKSTHQHFETYCRLLYQSGSQKLGLGTGRQFDLIHLTECALWREHAWKIKFSLMPAIPQSYRTLAFFESTADGRDQFWMPLTEATRAGRQKPWRYLFVPWYAEPRKYSRRPPDSWIPSDESIAIANKIYETSPEFFFGKNITISKYSLYWHETTRKYYEDQDDLAYFLTNYCSTPEESFQDNQKGGFTARMLERWRLKASWNSAVAYELPVDLY